ncbi:MAG: FtsW/RodA/SpoVE family cell cycle protein [Clostridiales bacterium]|nr:FtsW/RodA/SpoVE family cell cycle protein [Clostridiales bacterium]
MKFLKSVRYFIKETDLMLLLTCVFTSAFGLLVVHSATLNRISDGALISRDTKAMLIAVVLGIVACVFISAIDYEIIIHLWPIIAIFSLLLMGTLFIWGEGPAARPDVKTWLRFGSFYFQPSELLKVAFIVTFAMHADMLKDKINKPSSILQLGIHALVPAGLVFITGDLGSALVFICIFGGIMFVSGVYIRYFFVVASFAVAAIPILWLNFFSEFQKQRFLAVYYPRGLTESAYNAVIYQQQQGISAIGSGGIKGSGLFNGVFTQNELVPESKNDMIFTVVGEELGLLGGLALLAVLFFIVIKIVLVAKNTNDNVSRLLCYGSAFMIAGQIVINIGVCLKLFPVIGITLPLVSSGGSSNLCVYLTIGIVLSVYRFNKERAPVNFRLSGINTPFSDV